MAYKHTVMDFSNSDKVQLHTRRSLGVQEDWQVLYSEGSMKRLSAWRGSNLMRSLLKALSQIPGVLLPEKLPGKLGEGYHIKAPEGEWIPAGELRDLRSLHSRQLTVMDLWNGLAAVCDTLEDLRSLGVWGWTEQSKVLLCNGGGHGGQKRFFLTDVADYNIYRFSQSAPEMLKTEEDLTTRALRVFLGEMALCADRQALLFHRKTASSLEIQLGTGCTRELSDFFRTPSHLPPQFFLQRAKSVLAAAAESLEKIEVHKFQLYIVLLGGNCCQADVPALSKVTRAFQQAVEVLREQHDLSDGKVTCIFPWESVQLCSFDPKVVLGLSALPRREAPRKQVPWGGLLDCLDQELERNIRYGDASLVFCIELQDKGFDTNGRSLSCMEQYLAEKLRQKEAFGVFRLLVCSNDLRPPSQLLNYLTSEEEQRRSEQLVMNESELSPKLYTAMKELLAEPRYVYLN